MGPQSTWRDEIYKIIRPGAISTHQFIENAPAYLGPFLHYRGMLKLNSGNDYFSAAADFDLALRINSYAVEYHVAIAQEAGRLIASCIFHRQLAINIANKDTALFRELAKTNDPEGAAHFEPRFEREIVWSA
jgi:hypothetical protein